MSQYGVEDLVPGLKQLIPRLREYKVSAPPEHPVHPKICDEAADAIEKLIEIHDSTLLQAIRLMGPGGSGVTVPMPAQGAPPEFRKE